MKIDGIKFLNKNDYNTITIGEKIKINSDDVIDTIPSGYSFNDQLKYLNDEEKIERITEYFLDYNKISFISGNYFYNGNHPFIISSPTGKLMRFFTSAPNKKMMRKIIKKYTIDRLDYMSNISSTNINDIIIYASEAISDYKYKDGTIILHLATQKGKLCNFEMKFLNDLINIFSETDEVRIKNGTLEYWWEKEFYINANGRRLWIKNYISYRNNILNVINAHNCSIRKQNKEKVLQLKMEGF